MLQKFGTLRWIRPGNIAMLIGVVCAAPFDLWIAHMSVQEVIVTRCWLVLVKFPLGGIYEKARDAIVAAWVRDPHLVTLKTRAQVGAIDAVCYCVIFTGLYAFALGVQHFFTPGKNAEASMNALAFTAIATLLFGGVFGVILDILKAVWAWRRPAP